MVDCYQSYRCIGSQCSSMTFVDCFTRDLRTRTRDRDSITSIIIWLYRFNILILRISSSSHWSSRDSCQYLVLAILHLAQSYGPYLDHRASTLYIRDIFWTNRSKEAFFARLQPNVMDMLFQIMVQWAWCQHVISGYVTKFTQTSGMHSELLLSQQPWIHNLLWLLWINSAFLLEDYPLPCWCCMPTMKTTRLETQDRSIKKAWRVCDTPSR